MVFAPSFARGEAPWSMVRDRDPRNPEDGAERSAQTGEDRDRAADDRDRTSEARDGAADARDDRANARDVRAAARDDRANARDDRADDTEGVQEGASSDRGATRRDRREALLDRSQAARDRKVSRSDRVMSAEERTVASIDQLTGAYRRDPGMMELQRELDRARRTGEPFTVAFVDLDGLKATNDSLGHAAGDRLLRRTAEALREHLRSYDVVVRFGGDEFVCGMVKMQKKEAGERFLLVNAKLSKTQHASVTAGLAESRGDDSLDDLIARADDALYKERQRRRPDQV